MTPNEEEVRRLIASLIETMLDERNSAMRFTNIIRVDAKDVRPPDVEFTNALHGYEAKFTNRDVDNDRIIILGVPKICPL